MYAYVLYMLVGHIVQEIIRHSIPHFIFIFLLRKLGGLRGDDASYDSSRVCGPRMQRNEGNTGG